MARTRTDRVSELSPRPVSIYWAISSVVAVLMVSQTLNRQWSGDASAHAAAVAELSRNLLRPEEPFVGGEIPSPYLNPWSVTWGWLAGVFNWDAHEAMVASGIVNLTFILFAFRAFMRELDFDDRSSALALVAAVVLWGFEPWRWSGFVSLNSLGFFLPYPSATGFALMLVVWTLCFRWFKSGRTSLLAVVSALFALLLLSHPFSALNTAVGIAAATIAQARGVRSVVLMGVSVGLGLLFTLLWPLYPIIEAVISAGDYDAIHESFYQPRELLGLALILAGLPPLASRWRANRRDFLVWLFILASLVYLLGWATNAGLGRVIPALVLGPQLALAQALVGRSAGRIWRIGAVAALVVGFVFCLPGLTRAVPSVMLNPAMESALRFRDPPGSRQIEQVVDPDDVVLSLSPEISLGLVSNGARVVEPPYIQPLIPDNRERSRVVSAFPQLGPAARAEVLDRFDVSWIVWPVEEGQFPGPGRPVAQSEDGRFVLLSVQQATEG